MNSENKERIDIADLSLEWLEKYPVWTWYIGSLFEPEDEIIPVDLNSESIDEIDVLFARAEFTTVDGLSLKGWISYDIDADNVYNIDFFYENHDFGFNSNLKKLAADKLARFRKVLNDESLIVFPIAYKSAIAFDDGQQLCGYFNPC